MGRIGIPEILLIMAVIVIFFGVKRLPEIGSSIGKAIREFQKALKGDSGNDDPGKTQPPSASST